MELEIKTKLCYHCNQTKPESEFYYYRPKKCKTCCRSIVNNKPITPADKKLANKKFYLAHKEQLKQINKENYHKRKLAQQQQAL